MVVKASSVKMGPVAGLPQCIVALHSLLFRSSSSRFPRGFVSSECFLVQLVEGCERGRAGRFRHQRGCSSASTKTLTPAPASHKQIMRDWRFSTQIRSKSDCYALD